MTLDKSSCWFALRTRSRHEKHVRDQLHKDGVEQFLPTVLRKSEWKDRQKKVEFPLFPGYCFAKFFSQNRLPILKIRGVVQIVGTMGAPEPIPEGEVEGLQRLMSSGLLYFPFPFLQEGMKVEVIRGPLTGVRGDMIRRSNYSCLVIGVNLIQQAVTVEIDAADVVPVK